MPPSGQLQKRAKPKSPVPVPIPLIFVLLSFLCILGLDFINWRTGGEPSMIFSRLSRLKPQEAEPEVPKPLAPRLAEFAAGRNIPSLTVRQETDELGLARIVIQLPEPQLNRAESMLRRELGKQKGSIILRDKTETDSALLVTWHVQGPGHEGFTVLFSCPKEKKEKPVKAAKKEMPAKPPAKYQAAIIIDDLGNSLSDMREICALGKPLTVSILPHSSFPQETAEIAHRAGLEVMLHVPTESLNHQEEDYPGEIIIRSGMAAQEIRKIMEDFLGRVPYVTGVNNHMGSKATQDEAVMREILGPIKDKGLFFLDSLTIDQSLAYGLAKSMGIPSARRNVFLDSIQEENAIKRMILNLFRLAQKQSPVVGIGHPFPETLSALKQILPLAEKYRVELVFASQIIKK